ncbi:hypothetical protein LE190_08630 [Massilia oculi]|uniref:Uncharacterized protein n=1 Tax=Massilia hydrophila TaxID=3044279 RepID=A0ABS7YA71_9BURK|nr:hypothetical protein [Massilia oculi]MCA1855987.1 hypothetical protein [Massilia oculi]
MEFLRDALFSWLRLLGRSAGKDGPGKNWWDKQAGKRVAGCAGRLPVSIPQRDGPGELAGMVAVPSLSFPALLLAIVCLLPGAALAGVSDKLSAPDLFWVVGLAASTVCLVGARLKPWLGAACFVPAALWFIGLLAELHAVDIASHLVAERGPGYYVQAHAAFGLVCGGFAMGWRWHRRSARASCAAEKR